MPQRIGIWWWEKDSNLRSFRNRFTVCPLWPLGNPTKEIGHLTQTSKLCQTNTVKKINFNTTDCFKILFFFYNADVFCIQFIMCFRMFFINQYAIDRAYLLALRLIIMTNALCAQIGVDFVDFLTLGNCVVWTFRFTDITIDAVVRNKEGHNSKSFSDAVWLKLSGADYSTTSLDDCFLYIYE